MSPAPGRAAPGPLWYPSRRSLNSRRAVALKFFV